MLVRKENKIIKKSRKESFDRFREIESTEDVLNLLSEETLDMYDKLKEVYQEEAMNKLLQRVDVETEDEEEIDACMQDIIKFELY